MKNYFLLIVVIKIEVYLCYYIHNYSIKFLPIQLYVLSRKNLYYIDTIKSEKHCDNQIIECELIVVSYFLDTWICLLFALGKFSWALVFCCPTRG